MARPGLGTLVIEGIRRNLPPFSSILKKIKPIFRGETLPVVPVVSILVAGHESSVTTDDGPMTRDARPVTSKQ